MKNLKYVMVFVLLSVQASTALGDWLSDTSVDKYESPLFFSSPQLEDIQLSADFTGIFTEARKGSCSMGLLDYTDPIQNKKVSLRAMVSVRGATSVEDCDFKKLKIKFVSTRTCDAELSEAEKDLEKDAVKLLLKGTVFEKSRTLKLGTHCSSRNIALDSEDRFSPVGRLRNEAVVARESLAYEVLTALEVPAPLTLFVKNIKYFDTGTHMVLDNKPAFFLEDYDSTAKRLGGKRVKDDLEKRNAGYEWLEENGSLNNAKILLIQALFGNADGMTSVPARYETFLPTNSGFEDTLFWNIKLVEKKDGTFLLFPYDFDVSTWVTGHMWTSQNIQVEALFKIVSSIRGKDTAPMLNYGELFAWERIKQLHMFVERDVLEGFRLDIQKRSLKIRTLINERLSEDLEGLNNSLDQLDWVEASLVQENILQVPFGLDYWKDGELFTIYKTHEDAKNGSVEWQCQKLYFGTPIVAVGPAKEGVVKVNYTDISGFMYNGQAAEFAPDCGEAQYTGYIKEEAYELIKKYNGRTIPGLEIE